MPTATNYGAASALPYHLIKFRRAGIDVLIYSFNINHASETIISETERVLGVRIRIIPLPNWYNWMFKFHLLFLRVFLKYPFMSYITLPKSIKLEIDQVCPDGIWIYVEELTKIACLFNDSICVITTPDSEAMYYYRVLAKRSVVMKIKSLIKYSLMYRKYSRMEASFPFGENIIYHLVGKEDRIFMSQMNPHIKSVFINHPHYDFSLEKKIHFSIPKINILIAGRYDFYMQDKCDEMLNVFINNKKLISSYKITFLGKGWNVLVKKMLLCGYEIVYKEYVDNYLEELIKHDIQLTPIGLGTGTKGKVLDAFANGLMVIGTLRALENIAVKSGESCVQYDSEIELLNVLIDIPLKRKKYEQIAERGRIAVLKKHDREIISNSFFDLFN